MSKLYVACRRVTVSTSLASSLQSTTISPHYPFRPAVSSPNSPNNPTTTPLHPQHPPHRVSGSSPLQRASRHPPLEAHFHPGRSRSAALIATSTHGVPSERRFSVPFEHLFIAYMQRPISVGRGRFLLMVFVRPWPETWSNALRLYPLRKGYDGSGNQNLGL